jgi:hypothetical protein
MKGDYTFELNLVMIGRQLIGLAVQFITAASRNCLCCKRHKSHELKQWEIDKELINFNSDTLSAEYLELGLRLIHISSIPFLMF